MKALLAEAEESQLYWDKLSSAEPLRLWALGQGAIRVYSGLQEV